FRADLLHRLNMYPIHVPALRERRSDIPLLAGYFLDAYRRRLGLGPVRLTERARLALMQAEWPGNVRELDHVLGRAVLRAGAKVKRGSPVLMGPEHFELSSSSSPPQGDGGTRLDPLSVPLGAMTLAEAVDETKRRWILRAVEQSGGNWAAAARALGMARGNLH